MASFSDLRNFVVQELPAMRTLRAYMSDSEGEQTEWVISDILRVFLPGDSKKHSQRWNGWCEKVNNFHKQVWPDREVPSGKFGSKNTWEKKHAQRGRASKQFIFDENTIPTSSFMVATVLYATHARRMPKHREDSYGILRSIIDKVCSASKGFLVGEVQVDDRGFAGRSLWGDEFAQDAKQFWESDLLNGLAYWVQSHSDRPHLADFIAFAWRPVDQNTWKSQKRSNGRISSVTCSKWHVKPLQG